MLTAEEFTDRMQRIAAHVESLSAQPDDPTARTAAELLRTMNELHAAGLGRLLSLVRSGGDTYRPLLEQFAQDDLIRSLLLVHDLHPIDLASRLNEAIDNLRPVVESYGGSVSLAEVQPDHIRVCLVVSQQAQPSPRRMLQELLENAILVVAPDVARVEFDDVDPSRPSMQLPIISIDAPRPSREAVAAHHVGISEGRRIEP